METARLRAALVPAAVEADDGQSEAEPPQQLAPPTAFTTDVFDKVDKPTSQEGDNTVAEIVQIIDAAAVEAELLLKKAATVDLMQSPTPAPSARTGVPIVTGTHTVHLSTSDVSPTEDANSSEEELPGADHAGPRPSQPLQPLSEPKLEWPATSPMAARTCARCWRWTEGQIRIVRCSPEDVSLEQLRWKEFS